MHRALKNAVSARIFVHIALKNPIISRSFVHCPLKSAVFSTDFVLHALKGAAISRRCVHCTPTTEGVGHTKPGLEGRKRERDREKEREREREREKEQRTTVPQNGTASLRKCALKMPLWHLCTQLVQIQFQSLEVSKPPAREGLPWDHSPEGRARTSWGTARCKHRHDPLECGVTAAKKNKNPT